MQYYTMKNNVIKTQLIGLKDFRQNIASYSRRVQSHNVRYFVLRKNKPAFEVRAIDPQDILREQLVRDVKKARENVKAGRFVTQEVLMKKYGLL